MTIGGVLYSQADAVPLISNGADKSLTMFRHVVSAKLNLARGVDGNCIEDILAEADGWLAVHGPAPSGVAANSEAWAAGMPLAEALSEFNEGRACAQSEHESLSPVEVSVGFGAGGIGGRPDAFRVRVKGQAGRTFILQQSQDFETWEDVATIDNAFGIAEAVAQGVASNPSSYFRVIPERGPAKRPNPKQNKVGVLGSLVAMNRLFLSRLSTKATLSSREIATTYLDKTWEWISTRSLLGIWK